MPHDVTSWFINEASKKTHNAIVRKFLIGTSDYSSYVTRWPKWSYRHDEVKPTVVSVTLANEEQQLNFIRETPTYLNTTCNFQLGFTHPTSGDELITLHEGKMASVAYGKGTCTVKVVDRFKQLAERIVGDRENPVDFTGSDYLLSDLAWWLCTSYGGLSAIESTSNPDIEYEAFTDWADQISSTDNVLAQAYFEGDKVTQALRRIARISDSAIYLRDNKIAFSRFTIVSSYISSLDNSNVVDLRTDINDSDIVNKMFVSGRYDVNSDTFAMTVSDVVSSSVNSYGPRERLEEDKSVWYVNSVSAINFAERVNTVRADPFDRLRVKTPLVGMLRQIGETATVTDSWTGIDDTFRVMGIGIDMDTGGAELSLDKSQLFDAFTLDVSTLDGPDVLA